MKICFIFCVFASTKDIWVSLILSAAFIILVSGLFNENSDYCVVSKRKYFKEITKIDYEKAQQIMKLYEIQKKEKQELENKKK